MIAITILVASNGNISCTFDGSDNITGIASSDVARYTASNVPFVINLFEYCVLAITENPHCGNDAAKLPIKGPALPEYLVSVFIFSE